LRNQIYQKVQQGESDQQIVNYLVARYGNFILYHPPFNGSTLALWFGPFIFLVLGMGYLFFYVCRK
jgi:cytochrome c-type biogenesis protein CcmH